MEDVYHAEQVLHIHGTIGADADYEPIMGHCNSQEIENSLHLSYDADEAFDEGEASVQEAVAKYLREIYKDIDHYINLNRYFFARLRNANHVVIIGWSAGEVDLLYLRVIKSSVQEDTRWTVYYYDQNAYNSLEKAFVDCEILGNFDVQFLESIEFWDILNIPPFRSRVSGG